MTALTHAKDSDRLKLLKEVAGTHVYEVKRQESLKIMKDTELKREKINELLAHINDRIAELEREKEELKVFYELDRERRCLEYAIYQREQVEASMALEEVRKNEQLEKGNRYILFRLKKNVVWNKKKQNNIV
jgi:structural maintenance of chromosome 3 (chondroitin sulfate proteoglycan 6)